MRSLLRKAHLVSTLASTLAAVVLLGLLAKPVGLTAQINSGDSTALVDLYNSTNGVGWTNSTNWLSGPVSSWYGITTTSNRVTEIDLKSNDLNGSFPTLAGLTKLKLLKISDNNLSSKAVIPALSELQSIVAGQNAIDRVVLEGALPSLVDLYFNDNDLDEMPSLAGLTTLRTLDFSSNAISEVPPLFDLGNLRFLYVDDNQLKWLPSLSQQTSLEKLYCQQNQIEQLPPLFCSNLALRCGDNLLDDLPDFGGLSTLTELSCENNQLDFEDLDFYLAAGGGPFPIVYNFSPQADVVVDKHYFSTTTFGNVTLAAEVPGGTAWQWFYEGAPLTAFGPTLMLGAGGLPFLPGNYSCVVSNSTLFPLSVTYGPLVVDGLTGSTVLIDGAFGNDTIDGSSTVTYSGVTILVTTEKWVVKDNAFLNLDNVQLYVSNPEAEIVVEDFANFQSNSSELRPTLPDDSWNGVLLINDAQAVSGNSTYHNAFRAFGVFSGNHQKFTDNKFYNCYRGVELSAVRTSASFDELRGNSFVLDECLPAYTVLGTPVNDFVGISIRNRIVGSFPAEPTIAENSFYNYTNIPCMSYCGILAQDAGVYVKDNDYYDMYCGVDMQSPAQYSVIDGDSMINLDLADCVATAFSVSNALAPVQITGLSLMKVPDQYDSIHLAISAVNCNQIWVNNCSAENFDHGIVANDVDRLLSEQNYIKGGYVGTYMRNVKVLDMGCTDIEDILCGAAYAIDNEILEQIEMNAPNYLSNKINFVWNAFSLPSFNEMNGDPDHDGDYSLRLFGCPSGNPAVACPPSEGIVVNVASPNVFENDMTTMDIEFTLDVPPFAFGNPSPVCGSLRLAGESDLIENGIGETGRSPRLSWADAIEDYLSGQDGDFVEASSELGSETSAEQLAGFSIYPNPAGDFVYLSGISASIAVSIEVYNSTGELVLIDETSEDFKLLNIGALPSGMYALKLRTPTGFSTSKAILKL